MLFSRSPRRLLHARDRNTANICKYMDRWVARHPWARGGWVDGTRDREEVIRDRLAGDLGVTPIQQVRSEIISFVDILLQRDRMNTVFEIGMGVCGGTHVLWSLFCPKVYSLDIDQNNVGRFLQDQRPDPKQSHIMVGSSFLPPVIDKAKSTVKECDLLFIDGDHLYDGVLKDWRNFRSVVRKGGIVAFHDTVKDHPGEREVARFIRDLEGGRLDYVPRKVNHIHKSRYVGISYYEAA